jgi:hypothetical protein
VEEESNALSDLVPDNACPDDVRRLLSIVADRKWVVPIFDEFDRFATPGSRAFFADTIKALSPHR